MSVAFNFFDPINVHLNLVWFVDVWRDLSSLNIGNLKSIGSN